MHALENHRARLVEDHANALRLAQGLASIPCLKVDLSEVETNMVFLDIAQDISMNAAQLCDKLKSEGVLMLSTGPRRVRAVCHLDVDSKAIDRAIQIVATSVTGRVLV